MRLIKKICISKSKGMIDSTKQHLLIKDKSLKKEKRKENSFYSLWIAYGIRSLARE